jgi:type II secretory pathway pseudopilin PulG
MRKWNSEKGMSLVEATIILMVLAILTAVIAPSAGDYINEARNVKAKEDVEAIGTGIMRVLRDTGSKCLKMDASLACTKANRVDLLVSGTGVADTDVDDAAKEVSGSASGALTGNAVATPYNWAGGDNTNTPAAAERATVDDQLITNTTVAYTGVNFTGGGGPRVGLGWRGAYLTGPAGLDPWGYRYQANTVFLGVATDASTGGAEGNADGGWSYDAMVLSPGTNGMVETAFGPAGGSASGDDVIYVIKGSTR